jgi:glycosyltransferase involved in cell wall biosynthesis
LPYKALNQSPGEEQFVPSSVEQPESYGGSVKNGHHLIFLMHKHPDSIGGVQRHSARLSDGLSRIYRIEKIHWKGPDWGVPVYFPAFYYKSIRNGADLIHCDDAVTSIIGSKIGSNSGKKVVATVHGLDVILPIPWYQNVLAGSLKVIDRVVCVSRATAEEVKKRGIHPGKIQVIPNAAEDIPERLKKSDYLYNRIEREIGINLKGKNVLFSLGRPLRRKGFDHFIKNIFPHLPEDYIYIAAGPRPKTPLWIETIAPLLGKKYHHLLLLASGCDTVHEELIELSRHPRVYYLNNVSEELRDMLFAASDLFVLPNVRVDGDMEGFGIVALEAAVRGVPVIATGIEGITDAVIDGENGFCVPEGDNKAMIEIITSLIGDKDEIDRLGRKAMAFTKKRFAVDSIVGRYHRLFEELL